MKKWMTLLLCCVLALNLTACGAGAPGGPEDNAPPQASALHFEVATQVYENEYKADDGTVLLAERYELPVLELRTEDGELYTLAENVTANGGTGNPAQFTAQNAFNTEMNNVLAGLESEAAQMATEAKELYAENGTSVFLNGSYWTNELSLTQTYMTEGKLLSIAAENYTYYGGVHPNSATRAWSFDLTTGEFLTLDALASEEGDLQGNSLQESIYWNIYEQIAQKGLSEGYFDDYDSYLQDFPTLATLNFTENGLTVTFDQYVIAPYAAGPQVFSVPYSEFYNALSEHAGLESEAAQMATEAKELYAENGTSVFLNGSYWTNELSLTQTYMTEGKLLSIAAENYTYYGGVHPNSATRAWSFDLTTGEFLTLDALASEEGDLQGNSLQESIYWNIYEQIAQKGLSEGYFDDYDSYLQDFPTLATLNFTENGLTVTFDQYVIAPYAAGPQVFSVPYSEFYNALSEHAKTILSVSQEQTVTADFKAAATLWSWFYMDDPPMDYNVTAEVDGNLYDLADIKGVETLEGLRALLLRYVTPELADEWLGSTEQRYRDIDGRLYVMSAGRGGNESLGGYTCTAALDGDSGVLTQTVTLLAWDDTAQAWADTGKTEAYEYPFTLVDGHAVFSAFPCPY